ncbi:hypothetical protein CRUP_013502 [Coryphaenoides rupestris]|nr:hypothetical protein CRUP_013502 [Coryphaenoides rupestris]
MYLQEFIEQFRVLLPKNATDSREDISVLFEKMGLDPTTYQIGKTKVYLKELERQQLQDTLHKDVMRKIIFLQRWFRARLQRNEYLGMREAAILIQKKLKQEEEEEAKRRAEEEEEARRKAEEEEEEARRRAEEEAMRRAEEAEVHEKTSCDLTVVPENEPLDSDTEAEQNLMERIKSIKQEKSGPVMVMWWWRLLYRQAEPSCPMQRRSKPPFRTKPPDPCLQSKAPGGLRLSPQRPSLGSSSSSFSLSASSSSSASSSYSNSSFRHQLQRRNPVIPGTVKLPQGVLAQTLSRDPDRDQDQGFPLQISRSSRQVVRMREQSGRRNDSTQSLYVDSADCLVFSRASSSVSMTASGPHRPSREQTAHGSTAERHRHFSDPDLSCMDRSDD